MAKKSAKTQAKQDPDRERRVRSLNAKIKLEQGGKLRRQEIRDIEWFDARQRAEAIEQWIAAVPKGDYCRLSGRQHKLVDDAARNYSLPLDASSINLQAALTALHDLIAANAHRFRTDLDRVDLEEEKLRQQIVGLERDNEKKTIELQYSRGDAIPKVAVRDALVSLAARLRTMGQTLARIDPDARVALNDFLEALIAEVEDGEFTF